LPNVLSDRSFRVSAEKDEVNGLSKFHDFDFRKYKGGQPLNKIARNLVDYEAGKVILDVVMGIVKKKDERQIELF
jgi:DNA (cytosine-5)-methyltransferase 1